MLTSDDGGLPGIITGLLLISTNYGVGIACGVAAGQPSTSTWRLLPSAQLSAAQGGGGGVDNRTERNVELRTLLLASSGPTFDSCKTAVSLVAQTRVKFRRDAEYVVCDGLLRPDLVDHTRLHLC
jgi:hypothetical protein